MEIGGKRDREREYVCERKRQKVYKKRQERERERERETVYSKRHGKKERERCINMEKGKGYLLNFGGLVELSLYARARGNKIKTFWGKCLKHF